MERDSVQDPVCGMRLSKADAVAFAVWRGRRYHFCSEACRRSFESDPEQHLDRSMVTPGRRSVRIPLVGLACAAGDRLPLERSLQSVPGVVEAYVNPADEAAYLEVEPGRFRMEEAVAAIERLGARAVIPRAREEIR